MAVIPNLFDDVETPSKSLVIQGLFDDDSSKASKKEERVNHANSLISNRENALDTFNNEITHQQQSGTQPGVGIENSLVDLFKNKSNQGLAKRTMNAMMSTPKDMLTSLVTGMKAINVPLQRVEAAMANPIITAIQGTGNVEQDLKNEELADSSLIRERSKYQKIIDDVVSGLSGERLGQFGDVVRSTTIGGDVTNEVLAATAGFTAMTGFTNLASGGRILDAAKNFKTSIVKRLPQRMDKNFLLKRAESAKSSLDTIRKELGTEISNALKPIEHQPIYNPQIIHDAVDDLPENVRKAILRDTRRILKIADDDPIPTTIKNMTALRQQLDEFVPDTVWRGVRDPDMETMFVLKARKNISNAIVDGEPELVKANKEFHNFMNDTYKSINRILIDSGTGKVKDTGLRNLYKLNGDRGVQIGFEKFNEMLPQSQRILKDVLAFGRRQNLKKAISVVGAGGGGLFLLDRFVNRPLQKTLDRVMN